MPPAYALPASPYGHSKARIPKNLRVVSHGVLVFGVMTKEVSKFMTFVADNYRMVEA